MYGERRWRKMIKTWLAERIFQMTNLKTWKPRWEYPGSCWQPGCARCARWGVCRGKSESIFYLFERASWGIENLKVLSILLKEHLEVLKIWKYFPSLWKSIVVMPTCGSRREGADGERWRRGCRCREPRGRRGYSRRGSCQSIRWERKKHCLASKIPLKYVYPFIGLDKPEDKEDGGAHDNAKPRQSDLHVHPEWWAGLGHCASEMQQAYK